MKQGYQRLVLVVSFLGCVHFVISVLLWGMGFWVVCKEYGHLPVNWGIFVHAIPAILLFLLFMTTFILSLHKSKYVLRILLLSIILAIASFTYDVSARNYQMHVENMTEDNQGGTFKYFTWWWYSHY